MNKRRNALFWGAIAWSLAAAATWQVHHDWNKYGLSVWGFLEQPVGLVLLITLEIAVVAFLVMAGARLILSATAEED